jgi:hypothetical protein
VILASAVLAHKVGDAEAAPAVLLAVTVIVPVASTEEQLPMNGIV